MRALVMTGPSHHTDRTEIRDVEEPRPGPGEVAIRVSYAGINFADIMARRGDAGYGAAWPLTPGHEVAGTVATVGPDVTGFIPGDRVAAFLPAGGLAEIAVARAELAVPVPGGVPLPVAAAAPTVLATAYLLLTMAGRVQTGETVLVHSASGGVGASIAQLFPLLAGGQLIGTVGRPEKVAAAQAGGYPVALPRDADLAARVREAAPGGVDVVLDPLGTSLLDTDLEIVAPGGRIVLFGNAGGGQPGALPPMPRLVAGNISVGGFSISRLAAAVPVRVADAIRATVGLLGDGAVQLPVAVVDTLDDVPEIHQLLAEGRGTGKYVVSLAPAR